MDELSAKPVGRSIRSRILMVVVTLVAVTITGSLGRWQLSRADQKTQIARQREERWQLPAVSLTGQENAALVAEHWADRRVLLTGQWLPQHTVYLDNRQMGGHQGFWVMTAMKLQGSDATVMVQRGWLPRRMDDRTAIGTYETETGIVSVEGRIAAQAGKLLELAHGEVGQIRQNLDLPIYALEINRPLLPFLVIQTGPDTSGLKRQWPAVDTGVEKHLGYAFQWFGLTGLWVILYVWFQIIAPRRKRASA